MIFLIIIAIFVLLLLLLYVFSPIISPKFMEIEGRHVLITGGSSGIGQALAVAAGKRGANVTLLARNEGRLALTKSMVEKVVKNRGSQQVLCLSVDLTGNYESVEKAVKQAEEELGPVDMLMNCAGMAISKAFSQMEPGEFKTLMDVNYLGSVYATKAVVEGMKERRQGRIVFTSSQAGQLGLFGYTGYSASKFALRGLAEALQMEVKPYDIRVTLAFPPDTDTPGLQQENITKPKETQLIADTAGLFQPDFVARTMLNDAMAGRFVSYLGMDGWMLACLTCGMSPITTLMEATQQVLSMGLFRVISVIYLRQFDGIIARCQAEGEDDTAGRDNQSS